MCSYLSCKKLKTGYYLHRISYVNLTVTTRKKFIVNTQKKIRKESKHNTKENHQNTRKVRKRRKKQRGTTKIFNKMSISTYLLIITLRVNGLNSPIKRHRVAK